MPPFFDPKATPKGGLSAPATQRNRNPILAVLERILPKAGMVLEIASGTGEHAVYFAAAMPGIVWQPSDRVIAHLQSISAWRESTAVENVLAPLVLDVESVPWPIQHAAAVVNINMIHIAPWSACIALMKGAASLLPPGAPLFLYGPFKRDGKHTSESNEAFDLRLRADDSRWGVRDLGDVQAVASQAGFALQELVSMPANNLSIVFRREG
ncbi:MAG: DUF938 domain-containing protein [Deltaproteobacteria bacterium]|nr:DUF938 domain-containing protein [Deltaproteobacteria bacterium]